nr:HD domain-containing phosphohydrolase [Quadrisphaera sp. RL12-1S]
MTARHVHPSLQTRRARRVLVLVACAAVVLGPLVLVVVVGALLVRSWRARPEPSQVVSPVVSPVISPAVSPGPTQNYTDPDVVPRRARPGLALAVRTAVVVGPLVLALVVGAVAAVVLPPAQVGLPVWLWLVSVVVVTSVVLFACSRLLRRLAPLSALLRLSLVLPDDVPHRFALARRRWSPEALEGSERGGEGSGQRVLALVATLAAHDGRTRAHAERVQAYAALIGQEMGLSAADVDRLSWAALLHDVGKVHVPVEVINKAGRPSEAEWAQLQTHPHHGGELVEPLRGWLGDWLDGVEQHHERFDGTGYPRALAGEDIHLAARIIAVADTYDVITSARSYKKPMSAEQARAEITRCAGAQFDPVVVRALLGVGIAKLRRVAGPATLLAALPVVVAAPAQAAPSVGAALQVAGGHAATAVLAAGVGVTGGVATADVIAAPPGAAVLVVQEAPAPPAAVRDAAPPGGEARPGAEGSAGATGTTTPSGPPAAPGAPSGDPSALPTADGSATTSTAPVDLPSPTPPLDAAPVASDPLLPAGPSRPASGPSSPAAVTPPSVAAPRGPSRPVPAPSASRSAGEGRSRGPAAPTAPARKADEAVQKATQEAARKAAEQAAKDRADQAKAAVDAADKADKAAKAAKQAAESAGRLTGAMPGGRTLAPSPAAPPVPAAPPPGPRGGGSVAGPGGKNR